MEKIIINERTKKIHKEGCYCIREYGDGYRTFQSIQSALASFPKPMKICGRCLKNNVEIQKQVEEHNRKLKGGC